MTQEELWELAYKNANGFLKEGLDKAKQSGYTIEYNEETNEFSCIPPKENKE